LSDGFSEKLLLQPRGHGRYAYYTDLAIVYEGSSREVAVRVPDLSPRGMFINTPYHFPEGAILKISFRLSRSGVEVRARGEVRYCLPGAGVGVEFVDISQEAQRAIEEEITARSPA